MFISVLDWSAFAVMMLSCGVTIVCMHFGWYTDMPLSLLASGIIFPISFRCVAQPALVIGHSLLDSVSASSMFGSCAGSLAFKLRRHDHAMHSHPL